MAKIISPWKFSGKIGDMVYYVKNGKNFTRKLPVRKEKNPSQPMQPQQSKFFRLSKLLIPLTPLFRFSFKIFTRSMSGYNKAISANFKNGFMGEYPSFPFDFSRLLLGDGHVATARLITVESNGSGALLFTWTGNKRSRRSQQL